MFEKRFAEFVKKKKLIKVNDSILLSISGGSDSVCLAHLLAKYQRLFKVKMALVYFNHFLRPPAEIRRDIEVIEEIAARYGWEFIVQKLNLTGKKSVEEESRRLRYNELLKIAKKKGVNKIMTAHTANDNAETVLMWILRGTGVRGMSGIPPRRAVSEKIEVIRPLLAFEKKDILDYLKKRKLRFSSDKTNLTDRYFRNRIRNKLLPSLRKFNSGIIVHLNNIASIFNSLSELIKDVSCNAVRRCVSDGVLDYKTFFKYNEVIRYEVIRSWLGKTTEFSVFAKITEFLENPEKKRLDADGLKLEKKGVTCVNVC